MSDNFRILRYQLIDFTSLGLLGLLHGHDDYSLRISLWLTISAHVRKITKHIIVINARRINDNSLDPEVCLRIPRFKDPKCNFRILALTTNMLKKTITQKRQPL